MPKRRTPVKHQVSDYTRKNGTRVATHGRGSGTRSRRPSRVVGDPERWDRTSEDIPKDLQFRSISDQVGEEIYLHWRDDEGRDYKATYALVTAMDENGEHVRIDPDDLTLDQDNFDPLLHMIYKDEFTQPVQSDFTILGRDKEGREYDLRYRFYSLDRVEGG